MADIQFLRLATGEEVVANCTFKEETVLIDCPLIVEIETIMEEGRQLLFMKEYLPQAIVKTKAVDLPKEMVIFTAEISEDFLEQYTEASNYFYNVDAKIKNKSKKSTSKGEKVVSLFDTAMDKDKPVH
jgi:hypothetical protein